jgi:hypothetical protein
MKIPEMIQVDKLKTFENHPYKVEENEEMEMLTQSIKENGILSPLIVRPIENSEYEIISGHRRLFASKRAGLTEVPAFVYEMDRDKATIALDIHDRVNYGVTKSEVSVDAEAKIITLNLEIDTAICSVMEYFEIFIERMLLCKRAAEKLGTKFQLVINNQQIL